MQASQFSNNTKIWFPFLSSQDGEGKFENERERQAELMRLRLEKRKAEREGNFESAALVLGLAERNQASKEEK